MATDHLLVAPPDLRRRCDPASLPFRTTEALPDFRGVVGQERALKALDFGLRVKKAGFDIFVAGPTGTGRTSTVRVVVGRQAGLEPVPPDWCYVHNFNEPDHPVAVSLPPGQGQMFARDVDEMIQDLVLSVPRAFQSPEHEQNKQRVLQSARTQIQQLMAAAQEAAATRGFTLQQGEGGSLALLPREDLVPGPQAASLDIQHLEEQAAGLQAQISGIMHQVHSLEKRAREHLRTLDRQLGRFVVLPAITGLREKYAAQPAVTAWLERVQQEIIENIEHFAAGPKVPPEQRYPLARFRVNVLTTNAGANGAPVIEEPHPTWGNLFGKVEPGADGRIEDLNVIKAGALHRANGGYLVLQAEQVLKHAPTWDALKRALAGGEVRIEPPPDPRPLLGGVPLKPEPIPLQVKVILVGAPGTYQALFALDEGFRKLFKIKAEFDSRMDWTPENQLVYAQLLGSFARREGGCCLNAAGVASLVEYSARLAEDQTKLSTRFNEVVEVVLEAQAWAQYDNQTVVTGAHVERAIREKTLRSALYQDRLHEQLQRGHLLVTTGGKAVGQINGLTVLSSGDHTFGQPSRLTARIYMGRQGVVHIERETGVSGTFHTKGVLTLIGYLGGQYAADVPLGLAATLTFEQMYNAVDGDSASSTELYALVSALAEVPIDQGIAVTGSVDQHGNIQPVGGVMYKVEGWYRTCTERGLTGTEGVIIPRSNVHNLMLDNEVVAAVAAGRFRVWAIGHVDEGIEILTGLPAAEVHARARERLRQLAHGLAAFQK